MNLEFDQPDEAFRSRAREFFRTEYPRSVIEKVRRGEYITRTDQELAQRALNACGWLAWTWPAEHGGTGWTHAQRYIFEEEGELAGMAPLSPTGLYYIGPIICMFGTPEQQRKWLPDILNSRTFWAQGYSEPAAGSDLASVAMTAVRDGDHYILDGTKIWTSYAHYADWIFCLVRTSKTTRKQDGLSLICADLRTPGIEIHPIISMDGAHHLNRVTFDGVRVPADGLIGQEGNGWHYATVLLQNERLSYAHMGRKKADLAALRTAAVNSGAADDLAFMRRLARAEIGLLMLENSVLRVLHGDITVQAVSALKIGLTETAQTITELERLHAAAYYPDGGLNGVSGKAATQYLAERAGTIYGGATEIQKTIIWRQLDRGG